MPSFKSFEEMQPDDYAAIGFKSGLEIHQQLLTTKKLFCRCPAGRYSPDYDAEILRHMRPTLSELGEYDGTALMEFKTKKEIIYQINRETVCTYEMDDTPPFELNEEALDIALGIAMLYNCVMVDELHIARKQYLDGSIPTGFQRTTIVGVDGAIPYKDRSIRIIQLGLEEDACREVSDIGHRRVYLTDRLGMPLIETVTGPDLRTPQEVAEVAAAAPHGPLDRPCPHRHRRRARGCQCQRHRRHPHRDQGGRAHSPDTASDLQRGDAPVEPAAPARRTRPPRHHPGALQGPL